MMQHKAATEFVYRTCPHHGENSKCYKSNSQCVLCVRERRSRDRYKARNKQRQTHLVVPVHTKQMALFIVDVLDNQPLCLSCGAVTMREEAHSPQCIYRVAKIYTK